MFSLVLVDGHGQAILAVLTEYLRLLLLCVFQLPRSFATPALSVAHSRNLTTPLFRPLLHLLCLSLTPQPYHTHLFRPFSTLLCLSLTPATLPHPLFRPFATPALSVAHSRNLTTPLFRPFAAPALSVAPFSPPPLFLCRPSASLPLSYCKWSSKKDKTFDHEVESGRKGRNSSGRGGRPHGMTKGRKCRSPVFPGGMTERAENV